MLLSLKKLSKYSIHVIEGKIGRAEKFYFDDDKWTIRYVIVDTGPWFSREKVLISPLSIQTVDDLNQRIVTRLTRDQLLNSPEIDTEMPISRQSEIQHLDYYKWPYYWTGAGVWGTGASLEGGFEIPPSFNASKEREEPPSKSEDDKNKSHLRSTKEVFGYQVDATDAEFGKLDDFIVDGSCWEIRYLVVHTRKWLPSKSVLISKESVDTFSLRQRKIRVSLSENEIKNSPEFDPDALPNRDYEEKLHQHYGRDNYWGKKKSKSAA